MNPFGIHEPCIKIAKSEVSFEQYRMNINREKYDIEVWNDDAINSNQIFINFMQRMFNWLGALYLGEVCILIYTIIKYQASKQSAAEIEKLNRVKKSKKKRKEGTSNPSPKNTVLWIRETE